MKFIIEIEDKALEELRAKLIVADVNVKPDATSEVIEHLFYVSLGMYGDVDVRDQVKVKLIEEPMAKIMGLVEKLDPDKSEFQKVFDATNGHEGMRMEEIKAHLREYCKWDEERIKLYIMWFMLRGLLEGWILDEIW